MKKLFLTLLSAFCALGAFAEGGRIVLFGGKSVHGYGAHENTLACDMLKESLLEVLPKGAQVDVIKEEFPEDLSFLKGAKVLMMICEGEKHHPFKGREDALKKISDMGVNIALFHYTLLFDDPDTFRFFDETIGGHYEPFFSVNPHWVANLDLNSACASANGVKNPCTVDDEWYFNIRFVEGADVTKIAQAVPTDNAYLRADGRHSGNKYVRSLKGRPTVIIWKSKNANGTTGFAFTGWHNIWNYNNDNFRKIIVNSIAELGGYEVPAQGFSTRRPSIAEIDSRISGKKKPASWEKALKDWERKAAEWNAESDAKK